MSFSSLFGLGLIVLPIHFFIFKKTQSRGSLIIVRSVLFATLAAFFYTSGVGISKWFNHLDIAHTVMAISLYFFYRGTLYMKELNEEEFDQTPVSFGKAVSIIFKGN